MKIYSWNVNRSNQLSQRRLESLKQSEHDVICLQEVSRHNLNLISRVFHDHSVEVAGDHIVRAGILSHELYLVVITRRDPVMAKARPQQNVRPLLYRVLRRQLETEYMYVDIQIGTRRFRVFNCHLQCVASPSVRLQQLERLLHDFDDTAENIICGDLNTYGKTAVGVSAGWILGYQKHDYLGSESKRINHFLRHHKLQNVFHRHNTTMLRIGQLDYIVVPEQVEVIENRLIRHARSGSDHYPMLIEIAA